MSETKAQLQVRVRVAEESIFAMVVDALLCAGRAADLYGPGSSYEAVELARAGGYIGALYMLTGEDQVDIRKRADRVVREKAAAGSAVSS